jgi:signal transduction histidine kinase
LQTYIQQLQQARQDLQQIYEEARDYARSLEKSVQDRETNVKAIRQQLQTASIQQSRKEKNP